MEADCKVAMKIMFKEVHMAITTDGWTSSANESYTALTGHYIPPDWTLRKATLGCNPKSGKSTATDHVLTIKVIKINKIEVL